MEGLAVPLAQDRCLGHADQQVAQRSTAGFHLAQAVGQLLAQVAGIAEAGEGIHQVAFFHPRDVFGEQAVFHQQPLQGVAQAVGCVDARHQLLVHCGLADEVVDAAVEGLAEDVLAFLAGEQDDVGVVVDAFVQLADPGGKFQAVHLRHQPVGQEHADRALFELLQGLAGAAGEADVLVAGLAEGAADHGAGKLGVVDDQDAEIGVGHERTREEDGRRYAAGKGPVRRGRPGPGRDRARHREEIVGLRHTGGHSLARARL